MKWRRYVVKQLLKFCGWLLPDLNTNDCIDTSDEANVYFLNSFKDEVYLKLREFLQAYESCSVDCIAAVIRYKRTAEQVKNKAGSTLDFVTDWEDDSASSCIGIIKRLLTEAETQAYGKYEEAGND